MFYTVYKTTNLINGKIYVGKHQTADLESDTYIGSGNLLRAAIKKHGRKNFRREFIHIFNNEDEMNAKEAEIVTEEFCSRKDTYNVCPGGKGGWGYVNSSGLNGGDRSTRANPFLDPEYREKNISRIREAAKAGAKRQKELYPDGTWKGRRHQEESKRKIGAANSRRQSGSGNSQFGKFWITDGTNSKSISRLDNIPEGWYKGRKVNHGSTGHK